MEKSYTTACHIEKQEKTLLLFSYSAWICVKSVRLLCGYIQIKSLSD